MVCAGIRYRSMSVSVHGQIKSQTFGGLAKFGGCAA